MFRKSSQNNQKSLPNVSPLFTQIPQKGKNGETNGETNRRKAHKQMGKHHFFINQKIAKNNDTNIINI